MTGNQGEELQDQFQTADMFEFVPCDRCCFATASRTRYLPRKARVPDLSMTKSKSMLQVGECQDVDEVMEDVFLGRYIEAY